MRKTINIGDKLDFIVINVEDTCGIAYLKPYSNLVQIEKENNLEERVLAKIGNELSRIKPEIINEITLSVYTCIEQQYSKRIQTLEEHIAYLEKIINMN